MKYLIFVFLALSCVGCASNQPDKLVLKETSYNDLQGWRHDDHDAAFHVFVKSCKKMRSIPANRAIQIANKQYQAKDWHEVCSVAERIKPVTQMRARQFFETWFVPFAATNNGRSEGIFTGYFEIDLKGSKTKTKHYHYPLYKTPTSPLDRNNCRKTIDGGCLAGKGLELVYVNDPVRAFFLHIQGSGRVLLPDGKVMRIGYDGKNNFKYTSIGRYLVDKGIVELDGLSAQKLQQWLRANPKKAEEVMHQNESYVFFKELKTSSPLGGQEVELTPERSLAIDRRFIPYGVPLWLNIHYPKTKNHPETPVKRLMVAQDTGGAIKGPVRGDVFLGFGARAEEIAGHMRQRGTYALLLPLRKR